MKSVFTILVGTAFIIHGIFSVFYPHQTKDYFEKNHTKKHQAPIWFYLITGAIAITAGSVAIYITTIKFYE